jgi:outer membrane lipoprotein-sorting protein
MLRQSVMGSDLSYEDMMEDRSMADSYTAAIAGTEAISGRTCWVLTLAAKDPEMAYQGMKLWVDKERRIPLKQEFYAKSGTLLKRTELSEVVNLQGRWFPKKIVFKDALKEGEGTEFIIQDIKFNAQIPETVFSKGSLKK